MVPTIYVAGGTCDVELISGYIAQLKKDGWTISHDWTEQVLRDRRLGRGAKTLPPEAKAILAESDMDGVKDAAYFWLIAPPEQRAWGAGVELGAAIMGGKRITVSGEHSSIFCDHPQVNRMRTHDEAASMFHHIARHIRSGHYAESSRKEFESILAKRAVPADKECRRCRQYTTTTYCSSKCARGET